jgi:exopolyphosphatase/guanosine-5'-triphosphate,3'-diphosphate pyrophosphatase
MLQAGMTEFQASEIDGFTLTRGDAHRLVEELKWRTVEERQALPGMEPKRADVILAGALIFWRAMEVLDFPVARISTRGLRYGVFSLD